MNETNVIEKAALLADWVILRRRTANRKGAAESLAKEVEDCRSWLTDMANKIVEAGGDSTPKDAITYRKKRKELLAAEIELNRVESLAFQAQQDEDAAYERFHEYEMAHPTETA